MSTKPHLYDLVKQELYSELDNCLSQHHLAPPADSSSCERPTVVGAGRLCQLDTRLRYDATRFAIESLRTSFGSKYIGETAESTSDAKSRRQHAVDNWRDCQKACEAKNIAFISRLHPLHPESITADPMRADTRAILRKARGLISLWLKDVEQSIGAIPGFVAACGDVGPGSVVDSENNDVYDKLFDSRLQAPSHTAVACYYEFLNATGNTVAEEARANAYGPVEVAECSARLSTVPKNSRIDRTIGVPTSLGQFLTRSIGKLMEGVLDQLGFGISRQPERQRLLAFVGSLDASSGLPDRPATVDFKSASLLGIFYELVRYMWGDLPLLFHLMDGTRESRMDVSIDECRESDTAVVHNFAEMGNGFTFALQTLIFLAIAMSTCEYYRISVRFSKRLQQVSNVWSLSRVIGVFGDDVILPERAYPLFLEVCRDIGLVCNMEKSFGSGPFKESCGEDYYRGFNVRGIYVQSLDTNTEIYSLYNRLAAWSAEWEVPIDNTLRLLLLSLSSSDRSNFVPMWEDVSSGIQMPSALLPAQYRMEGCSRALLMFLGPFDGWVYRPYMPQTASRKVDGSSKTGFSIYEGDVCWSDYPSDFALDDKWSRRRGKAVPIVRVRVSNAAGYVFAAIDGRVHGDTTTRRARVVRYSQGKYKVVPNWDYPGPENWAVDDSTLRKRYNRLSPNGFNKPWTARLVSFNRLAERVWHLL